MVISAVMVLAVFFGVRPSHRHVEHVRDFWSVSLFSPELALVRISVHGDLTGIDRAKVDLGALWV